MESFFSRYRNASILVLLLFAQVLGLAVQVKRGTESGGTRLIRFWVVNAITPFEKALVNTSQGVGNVWRNYFYLRGVRRENRDLKEQVERLRIEQVRLSEDAAQARRLQALLGFKEQFVSQTVAAQVIGTSGSDRSHVVYIDKGVSDGIKPDMAVITPDGIVGKVLQVYHNYSQVLLISDPSSGVGAILVSSRLQGILQGTAAGEVMLRYVMTDEKVAPGETVLTSGGDRIFPKGLPVGTVQRTNPGSDLFLNIRVKPAADLSRLEEVLVVTSIAETNPRNEASSGQPVRAADILAERLPGVPPKQPATGTAAALGAAKPAAQAPASPGNSATAGTANDLPTVSSGVAAAAVAATKAATKPAASTMPGVAGTATTGAATKPAVIKSAAGQPTASGDTAKPKPIGSAVQPAKPDAKPPQPPPGEDVSR